MNDGDYTTMREIGKRFNASSHDVGRWLTEIGLRTQYKEPSREAIQGGYCKRQAMDGPGTLVVWNTAKTVAALEQAGHQQIVRLPTMPMPPTDRLTGPFTLERSGINGYLIRGGDGTTSMWVYGEQAAQKLSACSMWRTNTGILTNTKKGSRRASGESLPKQTLRCHMYISQQQAEIEGTNSTTKTNSTASWTSFSRQRAVSRRVSAVSRPFLHLLSQAALRGKLLVQWSNPNRDRLRRVKWFDTAPLRRELEKIDAWAAEGFPTERRDDKRNHY